VVAKSEVRPLSKKVGVRTPRTPKVTPLDVAQGLVPTLVVPEWCCHLTESRKGGMEITGHGSSRLVETRQELGGRVPNIVICVRIAILFRIDRSSCMEQSAALTFGALQWRT